MIKYIQIFGERCSGTNFLAFLIRNNLENVSITSDFGGKHWFIRDHYPRSRANDSTDYQCVRSLKNSSDTLFLCIFRNPYDWVRSVRDHPYHANNHARLPFGQFIRKPWHSYEHIRRHKNWMPMDDKFWFIEEAINILHLRTLKLEHLLNLQGKVPNVRYINYEALASDNSLLLEISNEFGIDTRNGRIGGTSRHFGRGHGEPFTPTVYPDISPVDREFITGELNWNLENRIGYFPD